MTPYDDIFYPVFGIGCVIAAIASVVAARRSSVLASFVLLAVGVIVFWASLFIGSDLGFRAWQAIPNPPDEAFSDAAPVGALLFGWFPGGIFCGTVFAVTWFMKRMFAREARNPAAEEDGSPYSAPKY